MSESISNDSAAPPDDSDIPEDSIVSLGLKNQATPSSVTGGRALRMLNVRYCVPFSMAGRIRLRGSSCGGAGEGEKEREEEGGEGPEARDGGVTRSQVSEDE